jgi:hypothetical protein
MNPEAMNYDWQEIVCRYSEELDLVLPKIKELEQVWIPCEERLPLAGEVIREMAEQYKWGQEAPEFLPVIQDPSLPRAIICDIDGTLAHMNGRSPYDYSKVSEDMVDETIRGITDLYNNFVILVSGRPDSCRDDTEDWLENNGVQYTSLHMRKTGDNRNDTIVKREILDELIKEYYIEFALDDRDRVVKMFRESGIKCLQVAEGNF